MASIIRIKRSSGTAKPASLNWGEMAYVTGIGQYGGVNQYKDRIFLGDDGTNVNPVACQFHPEFTSKPKKGHPLFNDFIKAAEIKRDKK